MSESEVTADSGAGALVPADGAPNMMVYAHARRALERAHKIDEVTTIRNKADALKQYAYQAQDTYLMFWAAEIKLRAEQKAGKLICEMRLRGEIRRRGGPVKKSVRNRSTLKELGIRSRQVSDWINISKIPEADFEKFINKNSRHIPTTAGLLRLSTKFVEAQTQGKDRQSIVEKQFTRMKKGWGEIYPLTRQRFRHWIDQPEQQEQPIEQ